MYDDTFDGAQLNVGNDKVQVQGAYGYMMAGAADGNSKSDNPSVAYVGVKGKVGQESTVGGFYSKLSSGNLNHNGSTVNSDSQDVYGFNADLRKDKVWVGGEWLKASNVNDPKLGQQVQVMVITTSLKKVHGCKGQYFNQKANLQS